MEKEKNKNTPYIVERNEVLGRYLVTGKDMKAGETIIVEKPVVVGPRNDSSILCLNCYRSLRNLYKWIICPNCKIVPLCNINCKSIPLLGHNESECMAYKSVAHLITPKDLLNNLQIVTPLRCFLLMKSNKDKWDELMKLESHMEKRRNTPIWKMHEQKIIRILRNWNLISDNISDDILQHIMGILDVNSFEIRVPNSENLGDMPASESDCIRGLYLKASLLAHECLANTHAALDEQFNLTLRCSIDIKQNQIIYFNYTNALLATFDRQEHLREGKYFECSCQRCQDPTELDTHLSSILCTKCKKGYVNPISTEHSIMYSSNLNWKCENCAKLYSGSLVRSTMEVAKDEYDKIDKLDFKESEKFLKRILHSLPSENSLVIDVKQNLIGAYRDVLRRERKPSKYILQRKFELCKELLPLLEKIEPGISRLKGITLYEMHIPLVVLSNREYEAGDITAEYLLERLLEAEQMARDAIRFLLYEPKTSPEGRLAQKALEELKMLKNSIFSVQEIVNSKKRQVNKKRNKRTLKQK